VRAEARQGALWVYLETTDPGDGIRPDCAASGHGSRALGWNEWEAGIPQGIEVEPHKEWVLAMVAGATIVWFCSHPPRISPDDRAR